MICRSSILVKKAAESKQTAASLSFSSQATSVPSFIPEQRTVPCHQQDDIKLGGGGETGREGISSCTCVVSII